MKVSLASSVVSPLTGTVTVLVVSPGGEGERAAEARCSRCRAVAVPSAVA